ncbi:class II fructose-bisphosphate aldolase [Acetobacterium bakii]|uniref:Ketose-bisphosphate aldolase n=1 Tax=Acetobacterium bakii TaxID=52689 RepID=A0A0L6TZN5_9FIRM|nr:class II fructose-bisphosphate aldolase [Acetobacterium bakii]KNZ41542.1 ketose-bisphosphate aldolase [Acetobacterium bakii]
MLVNLSEILKIPTARGFAVGAFNTPNLESIQAVIAAAENLQQPVILNHAQIHEDIAQLDTIGPVMINLAKKARVNVCVHLDHGEDLGYLLRAMKMGFSSVMYDGSKLPYDENLENTCEIVRIAHCLGVSVEAELGRVLRPEGGGAMDPEDEALTPEECYTNPQSAKAFVAATGIDALAIAFGTAHGIYEAEPCLDFSRIAEIHNQMDVPLVMHGGSGVGDDDFKKAIKAGISKINYFTYMSLAGGQAVKDYFAKNPGKELRFDEISEIGRLGMQQDAERAMKIFNDEN